MAIKPLSKWQCSMISSLPKGMASMQSLCMKCSAAHISVKETPSLNGKKWAMLICGFSSHSTMVFYHFCGNDHSNFICLYDAIELLSKSVANSYFNPHRGKKNTTGNSLVALLLSLLSLFEWHDSVLICMGKITVASFTFAALPLLDITRQMRKKIYPPVGWDGLKDCAISRLLRQHMLASRFLCVQEVVGMVDFNAALAFTETLRDLKLKHL